ncbi:MAG: GUN4 domain-containing protein [Cyanobacteria bacterium P01_C01_bin.120]
MQRLVLAGILTGFAIANGSPGEIVPSPPLVLSSDTRYEVSLDGQRGVRFLYPEGYFVDSAMYYQSPEPDAALQYRWDIWQESEYLPFGQRYVEAGAETEQPPHISIEIFRNPDDQPLKAWVEGAAVPAETVTVAGQEAIAYRTTGPYDADVVLLNHPNGEVMKLQVQYTDAANPMRQVFQTVVASLTLDQVDEAGTLVEIDYQRLQDTLQAGDWYGANLETIAILMQLSGRYDYFYPYIETDDIVALPCTDLQTIDALWSRHSEGRYGLTAQQEIWRSLPATDASRRAEQYGDQLGWRRSESPSEDFINPTLWRSDTQLLYATDAPIGHFPWPGVLSLTTDRMQQNSGAGCGTCSIDAMYIESDRLPDFLDVFMARVEECLCSDQSSAIEGTGNGEQGAVLSSQF